MARPRKFEENEVIQKAMVTFWQCGYEGTTMKTLQETTGVDGRGLVNAFGDKEQIFLKALDAYTMMASGMLDQIFEHPSKETLVMFFGGLADPPATEDDPRQSGCLMVNTVFELGKTSDEVRKRVEKYRQLFIAKFKHALESDGIAEPNQKAELLMGMLWGALSQIRLSGTTQAAKPMTDQILVIIKSW
jgi:TetR/AcrR family transcriptional repressor of nem operon